MDKDSRLHNVYIRRATANDQDAIRTIVRAAHLFPFRLHWPAFLVAEDQGAEDQGIVVGVGQIRPHRDGCRELASIAVQPAYQKFGIGSALVTALLASETGPVYLMCAEELRTYYTRFGFATVSPASAPASVGRLVRFGNQILALTGWVTQQRRMVLVMRR